MSDIDGNYKTISGKPFSVSQTKYNGKVVYEVHFDGIKPQRWDYTKTNDFIKHCQKID